AERTRLAAGQLRSRMLIETASALLFVAALALLVRAAAGGALSMGAIVLVVGALQRVLAAIQSIPPLVASLAEDTATLAPVIELLALAPAMIDGERPLVAPRSLREGILFDRVRFRYPG